MTLNARKVAVFLAGLTTVIALVLLIDRGGLIAWCALFFGVALLAKVWLKPSKLDLGLAIGVAIIPALAWVGTFYYVIYTWESGEVVELAVDTSERRSNSQIVGARYWRSRTRLLRRRAGDSEGAASWQAAAVHARR